MKIGLYFGSFNPLHNGHMNVANYVVDYMNLDKLLFIVSPNNPFKNPKNLCDVNVRIKMVESAISNNNKLEVSDIELRLSKPSYTINTINKLFELYGSNNEFYLIMGLDNWVEIEKWKNFEDILKLVNILVVPRISSSITSVSECFNIYINTKKNLDSLLKTNVKSFFLSDLPITTISSTFIRNNISNRELVKEYVPTQIYNMIYDLKLYNNGS